MSRPVTTSSLAELIAAFPDVVAQLTGLTVDDGSVVERATKIIFGNSRLVAHLAAIGRGVPHSEVKPGSLMNTVHAMGCLDATSCAGTVPVLLEAFLAITSQPAVEEPQSEVIHLRKRGKTMVIVAVNDR